eukprot:2654366-Rhodomonas_salina.1
MIVDQTVNLKTGAAVNGRVLARISAVDFQSKLYYARIAARGRGKGRGQLGLIPMMGSRSCARCHAVPVFVSTTVCNSLPSVQTSHPVSDGVNSKFLRPS